MKKIFVTYAYSSSDHERWVEKLVHDLEVSPSFHVMFDKYDLTNRHDKNLYMENAVINSDLIVAVIDENYCKKANNRNGGVGIEVRSAMDLHHSLMEEHGATKFIPILRQGSDVPVFLSSQFYIDFRDDIKYQENLDRLKRELLEQPLIARPEKESSEDSESLELSNVDLIIAECARNRKQLRNFADYSGGKKIKYEVWQTKSPDLSLYLALHHNINIQDSLQSARDFFMNMPVRPDSLTVLRTRPARDVSLVKSMFDGIFNRRVTDITYKEFLWEYGIDESLKSIPNIKRIKYYTNQDVQVDGKKHSGAARYLVDQVLNESKYSAHLIVASGGMGKTSLCLAVAEQVNNRKLSNVTLVLIQAELIRKRIKSSPEAIKINSIYDLYDLQASCENESVRFERSTFEIASMTGGIVLILDGLDEIASMLSISSKEFFESLQKMHKQLGSSQVMITSRSVPIIEGARAEDFGIKRYDLLGFTRESCKQYLQGRFKSRSDEEKITETILRNIDRINLSDDGERIIPFFVDVLANNLEKDELISDGELMARSEEYGYPCVDGMLDKLIFSIFSREKKRHGIDLSIGEMVDIFASACSRFGENWQSYSILQELRIFYDSKAERIFDQIKINPLLVQDEGDVVQIKYEFLVEYFESIYIRRGLLSKSIDGDFLKALSKISVESSLAKELMKYFENKNNEFMDCARGVFSKIVEQVRKSSNQPAGEVKLYKNAISGIFYLVSLRGGRSEEFTRNVLSMYGLNGGFGISIDNLHFSGDMPPMDFSQKQIHNSTFLNYENFVKSKFDGASFIYCEFDNCYRGSVRGGEMAKAHFDSTCKLGDLSLAFDEIKDMHSSNEATLLRHVDNFLGSFRRGLFFRDQPKRYIRFSSKFPGLKEDSFHKLIANGYIDVFSEKEVDTFYCVNSSFEDSVRKLLNDGVRDGKMERFFQFVSK
ncbi:TIR domain-containing protein [Chromobacterium haemolyticum]|uniref:TIR domain-containing protein n=1 Tax=Chromobacterium haemolyticum TaxID=394935 RepID=UPI0013195B7E|nr:toll/interleukin-1 receptor domain-containing protein [Chromobacterium haemolyticum]BBH13273.1 hypothetical protein CH06BL_25210 [Chromobacterium haemolyticum]